MAEIIKLDDFRQPWREVITFDGVGSTLQLYVNQFTHEVEIVQMNDEGETIRTSLDPESREMLKCALG